MYYFFFLNDSKICCLNPEELNRWSLSLKYISIPLFLQISLPVNPLSLYSIPRIRISICIPANKSSKSCSVLYGIISSTNLHARNCKYRSTTDCDGDDLVGQQYRTDTGRIDILAIKKDASEYLVIELKKGRPSDSVVGQIARYIGFIEAEVADENQEVKGAIIALDDDLRVRRALQVMPTVKFYRYEIQFRLTGE